MMSGCKKYNSLYTNPLNQLRNSRSCSEGGRLISEGETGDSHHILNDNKENAAPNNKQVLVFGDKQDSAIVNGSSSAIPKQFAKAKSLSCDRVLKPSSLQLCMQMCEPERAFVSKICDSAGSENSSSLNIWDFSDSEAAPASSWSTLPSKSLLCRPLPIDIGRCTCVIVKEALPEGSYRGTLYSLYTYEGQGRQNRKLAVAYHRRRSGKSHYKIAQNTKGLVTNSDNSFLGTMTANLVGSKYCIWDKDHHTNFQTKHPKTPLAVVMFVPTVITCTGSHRNIRAYIPKHQPLQLKNPAHVQNVKGLPMDWKEKSDRINQLFSRVPQYNNISKQYELDYKDRGRAELRIQKSVKNFQLCLEENGKQTALQLGRVARSKFVMDFRYPLTGYQAFCICLASIDSKLCCSV